MCGCLNVQAKKNGEKEVRANVVPEYYVAAYIWPSCHDDPMGHDGVLILNYAEDGLQSELQGLYLKEENGLSDNEIKCLIKVKDSYWLGGKYGLTIVPQNIVE